MNWTTRFRCVFVFLFAVTVAVALYGWLVLDRDPAQLEGVMMFCAGAVGVGEASNVGKRATWKRDAVEVEG